MSATRPSPLLEVEGISVVYSRSVRAIDRLSFTVGKGEIVALLGPNGAGKSTTMRSITGFLPGDRAQVVAGTIRFKGQEVTHLPPHRTTSLGLALIAERDKIFATLTVEENLQIGARANPARGSLQVQREFVYALFPILRERKRQLAGYLSGGERQMLAIAAALQCGPELLMVDELSLGLAPKVVAELVGVLRRINKEQGMAILLVEQSASVAFAIAQHVHVLNLGRSTVQGSPDELRSLEDFRGSYMGVARARSEAAS